MLYFPWTVRRVCDINYYIRIMPSKKKTILVIEDERPLLNAINAGLEKNGFNVIAARSVEEAFNTNLDKNGIIFIRVYRRFQVDAQVLLSCHLSRSDVR